MTNGKEQPKPTPKKVTVTQKANPRPGLTVGPKLPPLKPGSIYDPSSIFKRTAPSGPSVRKQMPKTSVTRRGYK